MKAFWWLKPNSIAGMGRPGFNYVHWLEMPFDEAVLFGWLGVHASGEVGLSEFREHLQTYAPRIFRFHRHDSISGPQALEIFSTDRGLSEVMNRLQQRTRAIERFALNGNRLHFTLSPKRLQEEIDFLKQNKVSTIVSLTEKHHSHEELGKYFRTHHFAIPDLGAPKFEQAVALAAVIKEAKEKGEIVVVHCLAGIGRTSTMLTAAHMILGSSIEEMEALVRKQNPAFVWSEEQQNFLHSLANR